MKNCEFAATHLLGTSIYARPIGSNFQASLSDPIQSFATQPCVLTRPYLFQYRGRQLKNFRTGFEKAREAAGVSELIFHDTRRTAVRNMVLTGSPEKRAMQIWSPHPIGVRPLRHHHGERRDGDGNSPPAALGTDLGRGGPGACRAECPAEIG
jgi:hypothetical protein